MTSPADQIIPNELRDDVFKELRLVNRNNMCLDCEKKNPKWTSVHLGIHLCIDCAGKHRQYGVMYSFVKSANLDNWNRKQLMFMQKGGNQKAIEYFTKCGVMSETQKHIDYKSPIVQRYKTMLTNEVDAELEGKGSKKEIPSKKVEKIEVQEESTTLDAPKEIPHAEIVQNEEKIKKKGKKGAKGKKIDIDFDNLVLDDGVPIEEKEKIVKAYESQTVNASEEKTEGETSNDQSEHFKSESPQKQQAVVEEVKEMDEQQTKQKLEELKSQQNIKSISSDAFKDNSINNDALKQNLNKFSTSQSISSSAFFNGGEETKNDEGSMDKIKDFVSETGAKFYDKISSYWGRS